MYNLQGKFRSKFIVVLFIAVLLLLPLGLSLPTYATTEQPNAASITTNQMPIGNQKIVQGVHIPPIWQNNTEITAYNNLIGKNAGIVMSFYPWDLPFEDWTCGFFDNTYRHREDGGTPGVNDCMKDFEPNTPEVKTTYMITWEPKRNPTGALACDVAPGGRTNLDAILNGSCNAYIDDFASSIKDWNARYGDRFMIRFMHEMNIVHSAWFQDDPSYPGKFKAAFQYVVNRFRAQGVSHEAAQFVWSPNWASFPARDWNTIPNYYPGDQYVDWIGLSGYNWYGANGQDPTWRTFDGLFVDPLPELGGQGLLPYLHCTYAKPIALTEFGTVDGPGGTQTKSYWIENAYQRMQDFPYVRAAIYFNDYAFGSPGNADFRITRGSSDDPRTGWPPAPGNQQNLGVTATYRNIISSDRYVDALPPLADVTPQSTYCGPFPPVYTPPSIGLPSRIMAEDGSKLDLAITGSNLDGTYTLRVSSATGGLDVVITPEQMSPDSATSIISIDLPRGLAPATASVTITATSPGLDPITESVEIQIVDQLNNIYLPLTGR